MTTSPMEAPIYGWDVNKGSGRESRPPGIWLSRLGIGLLSLFAKLTEEGAGGSPAVRYSQYSERPRPYGEEPEVNDDKCCHLALPDKECPYSGDKSNYTCPDGYYRQWWFCCEGTQQVGCGECTTDESTCWSGDFYCSIWWWTGQSC